MTNYVMLEWGQPLHAFDYDKLVERAGGQAPTITVHPARSGETVTTLDGQKRELTPDNLVIADTAGPVAIAGVMGGADTEVSAATKNILLESANFDIKGVVEALAGDLHLADMAFRPASAAYLHPGRSAELAVAGKSVGAFGQLHPRYADKLGLGGRLVLAGEFDLDAILAALPPRYAYAPVPRFPAALRDVAVIVDDNITAERVAAEIRAAGGDLLRDARLFDLYRGENIPTGRKSLAYALTYQAEDRTLTDNEVDRAHRKIEDRLRHVLQAVIRGKE